MPIINRHGAFPKFRQQAFANSLKTQEINFMCILHVYTILRSKRKWGMANDGHTPYYLSESHHIANKPILGYAIHSKSYSLRQYSTGSQAGLHILIFVRGLEPGVAAGVHQEAQSRNDHIPDDKGGEGIDAKFGAMDEAEEGQPRPSQGSNTRRRQLFVDDEHREGTQQDTDDDSSCFYRRHTIPHHAVGDKQSCNLGAVAGKSGGQGFRPNIRHTHGAGHLGKEIVSHGGHHSDGHARIVALVVVLESLCHHDDGAP